MEPVNGGPSVPADATLDRGAPGLGRLIGRARFAPALTGSAGDRRAALVEAGRLLEGVGQLQHAQFVLVPPDDLQADRQAFRREAAGHRDRRVAPTTEM